MKTPLYTPTSAAYDLHRAMDRIVLPKFTVLPVSPQTLPELNSAATSRLIIFGEYSEHTIFGWRWNNYRQRAHHDSVHLALQADTSVASETQVARQQCCEIERVAGTTIADIIYADLTGETAHMGKYGVFPTEQARFVQEYYNTGEINQW